MVRKPRDYQAEYRRRKELGRQRGLSVSQARGHARQKKGELPVSIIKSIPQLFKTEYFLHKAHTSHRIYTFTYKNHDPGLYNTVRYRRGDAVRAFVVIAFPLKDGSMGEAQTASISVRGGSGIADLYDAVQKLFQQYNIRALPDSVRNKIPVTLHLVTPEESA